MTSEDRDKDQATRDELPEHGIDRRLRTRMVVLRVLFLVGVAIMAYPYVSNALYQMRANDQIESLDTTVSAGDEAFYEQEIARAREYNKILVGETVPDVFAIREGTTDATYESFLNVTDNLMMGKIDIPVIQAHLPIYHYSTEESLMQGCGHIFGSSLPVGGDSSHAVITAHRGLASAKLFTDLDQVQEGDRFYITVLNQTLAYEVDGIEVVEPWETRSLAIKEGEDLVTLVTCTPYGVNTDRLLVHGHRVPYEGEQEKQGVLPHASFVFSTLAQVACILAGAGAALGVRRFVIWRKRRRGAGRRGAGSVDGAAEGADEAGENSSPGEEVHDER
jgi:sortase A